MEFIEWVQRRLLAHGFNPGIVDGVWGRNTRGAVLRFQQARGIPATGTVNTATVAALRLQPFTNDEGPRAPSRTLLDVFPWMELALRKKGLHERRDNLQLREFLSSDGRTLGDPASLPWCGDFVETCIAVSLPDAVLPANPYLARNWLSFGQTVEPCFGAILVFWRGNRSGTQGHVGFYYSEDDEDLHVLGGNQSDSISIARLSKTRLLGARMPVAGDAFPRRRVASADDWALSVDEA